MSPLPPEVDHGVREALAELPGSPLLEGVAPVGGGCINNGCHVTTSCGRDLFLKWNRDPPRGMFEAEADGLRALARSHEPAAGADAPAVATTVSGTRGDAHGANPTLRVPQVVAVGPDGKPSWLLLDFIPRGAPGPSYGDALGQGLALQHGGKAPGPASERFGDPGGDAPEHLEGADYGWHRPNYIGSLPQSNTATDRWHDFWREQRLAPQVRLARDRGFFQGSRGHDLDVLLERLDDLLDGAEAEGPSLVHGDLWGGNAYPGPRGEPVIIDPAVYRGHREVDLAMSELFGGFPDGFHGAYREAWPVAPEYDEVRRDVYQLYYLLVHVNLFGGSYVAGSMERVRRALSA